MEGTSSLLVGALPPFGEVLRLLPLCVWRSATWQFEALPRSALIRDEPILEEPFHVMSHHRISVEPTEDIFGGHVVHDLMIELFPDVKREAGDFAFAGSHGAGPCRKSNGSRAKSAFARGFGVIALPIRAADRMAD